VNDSDQAPTADLGVRVAAARAERGLSLAAAASASRISPGYLHKLESGRVRSPSPHVLQRLAGTLTVPYAELMRLAGYVLPAGTAAVPAPAPARRRPAGVATNEELLRALERLSDEVRTLRHRQDELLARLAGPAPPAAE